MFFVLTYMAGLVSLVEALQSSWLQVALCAHPHRRTFKTFLVICNAHKLKILPCHQKHLPLRRWAVKSQFCLRVYALSIICYSRYQITTTKLSWISCLNMRYQQPEVFMVLPAFANFKNPITTHNFKSATALKIQNLVSAKYSILQNAQYTR